MPYRGALCRREVELVHPAGSGVPLPLASPARHQWGVCLVQAGAQCTMTSTPSPDRIRLTISVTPETHAAFTRLSDASNMSLGRAMGEWLEDTIDAATYTASLMERARAAPKEVMQQVHAYALGLSDETGGMLEQLRQKGRADRAAAAVAEPPRLVIRGGKPGKTLTKRGGKGHG